MNTVTVRASKQYDILIGQGLLPTLGAEAKKLRKAQKVCVISETTVYPLYGAAAEESPAALTVADGKMTAVILWSSPNYDYMIVDGEKYLPTNTEGNSTFEIPVSALGTPLTVTADTVAMSTPHEIEYTLTFALN